MRTLGGLALEKRALEGLALEKRSLEGAVEERTQECAVEELAPLSAFEGLEGALEAGEEEPRTAACLRGLHTAACLHNEHTHTLKRAARKMERSWRNTKLEVFRIAWRESTLSYRKALKTARSNYFSSLLEENKHNPRYLFNTVAKLTKNKASTGVDISQQHSSNDFMNYFTSKINTIRDQIVTMQPSATVSHQIVHYRSPEEQFLYRRGIIV